MMSSMIPSEKFYQQRDVAQVDHGQDAYGDGGTAKALLLAAENAFSRSAAGSPTVEGAVGGSSSASGRMDVL